MTMLTYHDLPLAYQATTKDAEIGRTACVTLASLYTDSPVSDDAVPFMQLLGSSLFTESGLYTLTGIRFEVARGEVGFSLLLSRGEPGKAYQMAFPTFPQMTRLHPAAEPTYPIAKGPGGTAALMAILAWVEHLHPGHGAGASPACLELSRQLHQLATKRQRAAASGLSVTLSLTSLVLATGGDLQSEETLWAAPIPRRA